MSKIRDRVKEKVANVVWPNWRNLANYHQIKVFEDVDEILSIPELAIVDREAELPLTLSNEKMARAFGGYDFRTSDMREVCKAEQKNMLKAGWVKEVL